MYKVSRNELEVSRFEAGERMLGSYTVSSHFIPHLNKSAVQWDISREHLITHCM
jgi:hypothetical protein